MFQKATLAYEDREKLQRSLSSDSVRAGITDISEMTQVELLALAADPATSDDTLDDIYSLHDEELNKVLVCNPNIDNETLKLIAESAPEAFISFIMANPKCDSEVLGTLLINTAFTNLHGYTYGFDYDIIRHPAMSDDIGSTIASYGLDDASAVHLASLAVRNGWEATQREILYPTNWDSVEGDDTEEFHDFNLEARKLIFLDPQSFIPVENALTFYAEHQVAFTDSDVQKLRYRLSLMKNLTLLCHRNSCP